LASRPANRSAESASTVPNPTSSSYPPGGRCDVDHMIARRTSGAVSFGYSDLTSATTPAVSAHAGLVPLTTQ